jgi:hypothetical protein
LEPCAKLNKAGTPAKAHGHGHLNSVYGGNGFGRNSELRYKDFNKNFIGEYGSTIKGNPFTSSLYYNNHICKTRILDGFLLIAIWPINNFKIIFKQTLAKDSCSIKHHSFSFLGPSLHRKNKFGLTTICNQFMIYSDFILA